MKRQFVSIESIAEYKNLHLAAYKTFKGRTRQPDIVEFRRNLPERIVILADAIHCYQVPFSPIRKFIIYDPKLRHIVAASLPDRIIHHAIFNVIGERIERSQYHHSYACRPNKGVHKAIVQVQSNMRRFPVRVQMDVSQYFDHIDHGILQGLLDRQFKGQDFQLLLGKLISAHPSQKNKGLPIGWLSSQYFANLYLDGFDRWLAEHKMVKATVRYMDDIVFWCTNKSDARHMLHLSQQWLSEYRQLLIKSTASIQSCQYALTFGKPNAFVGEHIWV